MSLARRRGGNICSVLRFNMLHSQKELTSLLLVPTGKSCMETEGSRAPSHRLSKTIGNSVTLRTAIHPPTSSRKTTKLPSRVVATTLVILPWKCAGVTRGIAFGQRCSRRQIRNPSRVPTICIRNNPSGTKNASTNRVCNQA